MSEDLINRITYHLSSGGLFNPELADHLTVRSLLMECREALAQPEQEPVGWLDSNDKLAEFMHKDLKAEHDKRDSSTPRAFQIPVYTTPPQRTWVGLTDEERKDIELGIEVFGTSVEDVLKEAEAQLKEKNT